MSVSLRISKEAMSVSVFVRRASVGVAPFGWEVHGSDTAEPIFISPERFRSMEAAYVSGQAKLPQFIPNKRSRPPGATANGRWRSDPSDLDDYYAPLPASVVETAG